MSEWPKERDWKSRTCRKVGRGFKSRPLRCHPLRSCVHTQTIEGFFGLFKNGVRGVYHSVSAKWLQGYVNEYVWRYNHRDDDAAQFKTLLLHATVS